MAPGPSETACLGPTSPTPSESASALYGPKQISEILARDSQLAGLVKSQRTTGKDEE